MRWITTIAFFLLAVGLSAANERQKRQASYDAYGGNYAGAAPYRQQQPQHQQAQAYHPQQQAQHYPAQPARPAPTRHHASAPDEEEKEEGPHPLQLLLEKSKFECSEKDGYYADSDVGCQAFHYCVSGQKHSMMCPAGTVFHQVHLNCVPEDQSICSNANKFFFVNDYLNKPLEQKGPNNTVIYAQRYYPENYAVGDPFVPPQESQGGHRDQHQPPAATYGLGPAYREQSPQPAYQQHAPRPQPAVYQQHAPRPQAPAHRPQPAAYAPQPAPHQPAPHQAYAPQPRPTYQQQQQQAYRAVQAHQAQPVQYGYGAQQQQAHQAQALQAQRAYAHHQQQATAPQQHLYAQQSAPRQQRYV